MCHFYKIIGGFVGKEGYMNLITAFHSILMELTFRERFSIEPWTIDVPGVFYLVQCQFKDT